MSTKTTCGHDSGSMTGNRPLCDSPATTAVSYSVCRTTVTSVRCDQHVRAITNSLWPTVPTTAPLAAA